MDHPNLSDEVNDAIASQTEFTGVYIHKLPVGTVVKVETRNSIYVLEILDDRGNVNIKGNGQYFNETTKAYIPGSNFGGSMLKLHWVGVDMYMEAVWTKPDGTPNCVSTSYIRRVSIVKRGEEGAAG